MEFTPKDSVSEDGDEIVPASNIVVLIPGASNKQEIGFEAGRLMGAQELTIGFSEGLPTRYPFDQYKAPLTLLAAATSATRPGGSVEPGGGVPDSSSADAGPVDGETAGAEQPQGSNQADVRVIPVQVIIFATLPTVDVGVEPGASPGEPEVAVADLAFKRSPTVVGFAVFAMIAMWGIAIVVGVQTWAIASRGRVPEPDIMSYMAALLFAFPVLRDSLPGTPPVGTLSDFAAFFWAEAIVALSLKVTLISWLVARHLGRMEGLARDHNRFGHIGFPVPPSKGAGNKTSSAVDFRTLSHSQPAPIPGGHLGWEGRGSKKAAAISSASVPAAATSLWSQVPHLIPDAEEHTGPVPEGRLLEEQRVTMTS